MYVTSYVYVPPMGMAWQWIECDGTGHEINRNKINQGKINKIKSTTFKNFSFFYYLQPDLKF